jgi:hypothetical protein
MVTFKKDVQNAIGFASRKTVRNEVHSVIAAMLASMHGRNRSVHRMRG